MAHKDRFGNVWVTGEQSDKLYKAARKLLSECDELAGVDLLPDPEENKHPIYAAMAKLRQVLLAIDKN